MDVIRDLFVPSMPAIDDAAFARVFDAWSWCASDTLEWRIADGARAIDATASVDGDNPPELVFVLRGEAPFLPSELARMHARGYGFRDELALAPWAIDDATDGFYEHRARPRDFLWLAAPSLRALVWGLHDWVHFHNHGPFDEPALTELQCDLVALAWLRLNRARVGVTEADVARVAADLAALSVRRFASEGKQPFSPRALERAFASDYRPDILRVANA